MSGVVGGGDTAATDGFGLVEKESGASTRLDCTCSVSTHQPPNCLKVIVLNHQRCSKMSRETSTALVL
jgi:hypothetical protein